jgi:hypothetical protein
MSTVKDLLAINTAQDFWRWVADQAKEKAADIASERTAQAASLYTGYAAEKLSPGTFPAPPIDLPFLGGYADINPAGGVAIHLPPAQLVTVDKDGTVSFGVPNSEYQISSHGQLLLHHYQTSQQAIARQVAQDVNDTWRKYVNHEKFMDSWGAVNELIQNSINSYFNAAEAASARYYASSRVVQGFGHIDVPGITLDPHYLDSVMQIMGPGQFFNHLENNADAEIASNMTRDGMQGSAARLVLNGGRNTITNVATQDQAAEGWERVIEPGACSFCAMLAGRGGVYRESTVDFRAHDHCHCVARPVFKGQQSMNQGLSEAWGRETKGTSGADARAAWDKYWRGQSSNVESQQRHATEAQGEGAGHAAVVSERE